MPLFRVSLTAGLVAALAVSAAVVLPAASCHAQDKTKPSDIPEDKDPVTTASGLKYTVLVAGKEGAHPKLGDKVTVHYTGWLVDGTKFDSSRDRGSPAQFTLGEVVQGWNEALALMTVGARWKLTIPPALGYGASGRPPTIPADATLVFDVELIDVHFGPVMPTFCKPDPAAQKTTASGLKYEVVKDGAGDPPAEKEVAEFKFAFWNAKGDLIDCSDKRETTIKACAADVCKQLPFMKEAMSLLKPGARLRFEVPPELAFGDKAVSPALPAKSTTIWELELVRVVKPMPVPPFAMPDEAKVKTTASGLKYEVISEGEGTSPKMGDRVKVHYAGWLPDGTLFDSSYGRGEETEFPLGGVIAGWNEGLALMKPGAEYKFVIPPALAYGARGMPPTIPANATLVFLIKLVKIGE